MALTYLTTLTSASNTGTYNSSNGFTDVVVAADGLLIGALLGQAGSSQTVSSVSLGGSAATLVVASASAVVPGAIYARAVTAGTHAVVGVFSSTMTRAAIGLWLLTDYDSATATDADAYASTGAATHGLTLDFPTNGLAVYGHWHGNASASVFGAATPDSDTTVETASQAAFGHKTASGAGNTETISWTGNAGHGGVGAVWAPAAAGGRILRVNQMNGGFQSMTGGFV